MEQAVSIGYGKENFATQSVSIAAFVVKAPFSREFPGKVFARQGLLQRFPVSMFPDINGYLFLDTLKAPDGAVLMVQSSHRYRGRPIRDGAIFLRIRNTGPMLLIKAKLPENADALTGGDFLVFQGRADVLTIDDLAIFGVTPPNSWLSSFTDEEEVEECYSIITLSEETAPRLGIEQVETADGEKVLVTKRRARRLNFRAS